MLTNSKSPLAGCHAPRDADIPTETTREAQSDTPPTCAVGMPSIFPASKYPPHRHTQYRQNRHHVDQQQIAPCRVPCPRDADIPTETTREAQSDTPPTCAVGMPSIFPASKYPPPTDTRNTGKTATMLTNSKSPLAGCHAHATQTSQQKRREKLSPTPHQRAPWACRPSSPLRNPPPHRHTRYWQNRHHVDQQQIAPCRVPCPRDADIPTETTREAQSDTPPTCAVGMLIPVRCRHPTQPMRYRPDRPRVDQQ